MQKGGDHLGVSTTPSNIKHERTSYSKHHHHQTNTTHRSLCSGVKLGVSRSRSSIRMKSFPNPSYFANSMESPSLALREVEEVRWEERVAKASLDAAMRRESRALIFMVMVHARSRLVVVVSWGGAVTRQGQRLALVLENKITKSPKPLYHSVSFSRNFSVQ